LRELKLKGGEYVSQILEKDKEILKLSEEKDKGIDDKKNKMDSELYVYMSKMQNFKIDYIQDEVDTILNRKNKLISENDELEIKINDNIKFINRANIEIEKVKNKIDELKNEKSKYEFYKDLQRQRDNLKSNTDKTLRLINDNKKLKDNYEKSLDLIKENEKINESIKNNDSLLNLLRSNRDTINNDKLSLSNKITLHKKILSDLEYKLSQYREQVLINEQHDVYLKLVHRSGLPTYLLSKNIDLLNKELSDLLTNTNFVIFFDEDLNLKLQHDGRVGEINVIETSGMERTFSAIVLKIVLRIINFKSKSNIMFFDEIINRLVGKSVGKFLELLETLKTKLDKIIIIEHNNEIMSDSIINVVKDKDGISTFEII
jgi:FtsZ-binding cell division protein ZapB